MKMIVASLAASSLLAALAIAQSPRYTITDLGTLPGGAFSQAFDVTNNALISGLSTLPDGTFHAVLWQKGQIADIGTPGLGGPNSLAFAVNERSQAVGQAETSTKDPNSENFCGFGTGLQCRPFLWRSGVMTPLPTLGGNNGFAIPINNQGQAAGVAETGNVDTHCPSPQVLDYEAVIWGPGLGQIRELLPLAGDSVGVAESINDLGQAVGQSGSCANTRLIPITVGPHAVLWENGTVMDLGNLGGTCSVLCQSATLGTFGNTALFINNQGQVVGASALNDATFHAFLWNRATGMQDLGTLGGDIASAALGINDVGEVVGVSLDANGNPRAFLRQNSVMTDLNTLTPPGSPFLALFVALAVNSRGEIAGFGLTNTFEVHSFLATPSNGARR